MTALVSRAEAALERLIPKKSAPQEVSFAQMQQQKEQLERDIAEQADKVARELMLTRDALNTERMLKANAERNATFYRQQYEAQLVINRKLAAYAHKVDTRLNVISETIDAAQHEAKDFNLQEIVKELMEDPLKKDGGVDLDKGVSEVVAGIVRANEPEDQGGAYTSRLPQNEYPTEENRRQVRTQPEPPMRENDFRPSGR